jgi:hypothetical protein
VFILFYEGGTRRYRPWVVVLEGYFYHTSQVVLGRSTSTSVAL